MATSLAEQLKKLRTPQTTLLLEDRKRFSLLFDPQEAASLEKETVLSIGQSGLDELIKLSNLFIEFKDSLFAQSSMNLERSIYDANVNKKLDNGIEKFCILLSPYFLLNTAHKALEWLIYRFRIHQYNKDQFLLLILPYHETRIFARALQLVDLTESNDKWRWLKPLQKPGVPLSSGTIINRVSTDNGLLKIICTHVSTATKIYAEQATALSTLYSFYTTVLIGAISILPTIKEVQHGYMLPTLLKGLSSEIPDFAASSYMIFSKLLTKVKLKDDVMEKLLLKIFKQPCLAQEAMLFLLFLFDSAFCRLTYLHGSVVHRLANLSWFTEMIVKLQSTGINVTRLIIPLIETACHEILMNPKETQPIQNLVNDIISSLKLEDSAVDALLSSILKKNFSENEVSREYKDFLVHLYRSLERKYPERFDNYLKNLIKYNERDNTCKKELRFLTSWPFGAHDAHEAVEILDRLIHASSEYRIIALEALANDDVIIPASLQEIFRNTLKARFNDNEINVIRTLLSFPVKRLTKLLSTEIIVDELIVLLSTCHNDSRQILAKPALKILLELCDDSDDTSIFIITLPYLFPNKEKDVEVAMEILLSNFAKNNRYMQVVKNAVGRSPTAESITSAVFTNILEAKLLPPTENILNAMKQQISHGDAVSVFFNMILLGSVCRVPVGSLKPELAREVIELATEMLKKYPQVKLLPNCNNLTRSDIQSALELTSKGILPLQVGTYVYEMVHRRLDFKSYSQLDFDNDSDRSNLILRLLEIFFEGMDNKFHSKHYSRCLQIFFQRHFTTMKDLIRFISQLFIKPVNVQMSFHCLQISSIFLEESQSMKLALQDNVFLTNLLLSLAREHNVCRIMAIEILKKLTQTFNLTMEPFSVFLQELVNRSTEISMDPNQLSLYLYLLLSPDPDVSSQFKSDKREKLQKVQKKLFEIIVDPVTPMYVKSQLLNILVHVNGPEILKDLATLGLNLLEILNKDTKQESVGDALKNILQRFNATTTKALTDEKVWKLFEMGISKYENVIKDDDIFYPPSIILLRQIDQLFFESVGKVSSQLQRKILGILLDIATDCDVSNVISNVDKAIRRISMHVQLIIDELQNMKTFNETTNENDQNPVRARRSSKRRTIPNPMMINSRNWKRGVILLEFVQCAENIKQKELLYPILFDLLKTCLSFEELSPIEYTNQLILSNIYQLLIEKLPIRDAYLQVDLIAQCIRKSRNPQTHYHALLVLVELLKVVDVSCAFHTIMPIFTFMGSSVVRQDDAYSIQIIIKTLETVIPIVNVENNEIHVCEILRTFIVSLPDIPEHRRTPLFVKLLQLLDNYLHLYYLLTFESFVLSKSRVVNDQTPSQRLEFALNISKEFEPKRLLQVCVKLTQFLKDLPIDIEEEKHQKAATPSFRHKHVFDVTKNTPKHLRHYKFVLVQFLRNLLSSTDFIGRVAGYSSEEVDEIRPHYDALIIELVLLIHITSKTADLYHGKPIVKYWKVLLHHLYDVLDLVNNLLPNNIFLISVNKLLNHELLTVKKKALELLNARLQQRKFNEEDHADLLELTGSLLNIIDVNVKSENQEGEVVQQTVLITFKLLAKLLASKHPMVFKPILELTTELLKTRNGPILGSAALCVAELCSCLRTSAIQSLNKFVPALINLIETYCHEEIPDVVTISIISAFQKIVESVGNFLSLYLDQILYELTRLNSFYTDTDHPKIGVVVSRLKLTTQKLASYVPLRVLLPAINKTYDKLYKKKSYKCIPPLLNILSESFVSIPNADLTAAIPDLTNFFLKVFQFREDIVSNQEDHIEINEVDLFKDIQIVEENAGKALVSLVLKLSEATFRPLYYRFYDWAARNLDHKERNITFFRLSANIAECLKSLFVLFAGHFLQHAAYLLTNNNQYVSQESNEYTLSEESNRIELVESILLTLHRVFSFDANNFVNQERFDALAQPIVDQLENTMGTKEEYIKRANDLIVPCIASFANAIPDDSLHKLLVYQTLLKTRHAKAYVRSAALNALIEIARKLGEDFMPLLPETVPFLAEMLEDEDEATEKCAQNAVRTLEEILGEPLQKYF
ncbi:PREDICTED: HEAT repeat-containing protein 1 isoform X1 [Polistes canadensis]|uniref:HEAT repeat-containing protein 1 isoform X1 n=1 Tax=Polistes canadensis TaxID=91411 RepID=UPI000718D44F|nr:PREDICTED: HEAT repeat-containing protein 1 isoform X1 [Polistes canadensis]XP_014600762.1 PREDICTED: HEAT repeat-containing protein 1 isoform X1 [Polistes canadensis]